MTTSTADHPLLITVADQFTDHDPRTLPAIVSALNVSERAALAALERFERMDVLVRTSDETGTAVWRRTLTGTRC
ncbi:hypothetical protein ACFQJC_06795 [Haloferax namakaokahaiae]|uniref:MarR family transcriptional regulator n=1 Tax=Haloferax namakaokahaiae TaxID=1748331 RepID=A0ABD5ZDJ3_9EURY